MDELPAELAAEDPPVLESDVCLVLEHADAARPMEMATASSEDLLRLMLGILSGCGIWRPWWLVSRCGALLCRWCCGAAVERVLRVLQVLQIRWKWSGIST